VILGVVEEKKKQNASQKRFESKDADSAHKITSKDRNAQNTKMGRTTRPSMADCPKKAVR